MLLLPYCRKMIAHVGLNICPLSLPKDVPKSYYINLVFFLLEQKCNVQTFMRQV